MVPTGRCNAMVPTKTERGVSGWGGAEPPSETVNNVQDYEPTEESQTRKQMKWKEEKERERQCNGPKEN